MLRFENFTEKIYCSGCEACVQICPHHCISIVADSQGFVYPKTLVEKCSECGLCEKICPIINTKAKRKPLYIYAGKNKDDSIRSKSSSGGVFHELASTIIQQGGVVFGAKFNENWEVVHDYTETIDGIQAFQGSKYVQSRINNCYKIAKQFLESSRMVLFSGTPCQIAGLKHYLRKEYSNLITVDIVCHGVPSPLIWESYIKQQVSQNPTHISFRDKSTGWESYSICIKTPNKTILRQGAKDNYMRCFIGNLSIRPSCFDCKFKSGRSCSDISLGDFWGINHTLSDFNNQTGVSLILVNTKIGLSLIKSTSVICKQAQYADAIRYNPSIVTSAPFDVQMYNKFWTYYYTKGVKAVHKYGKKFAPSFILRLKITIAKLIK